LGRWSDAERHFRLAAEIEERMGARPWLARTHLDYGTMLVRSGKRQRLYEAEVLVQQAIDTAQELGMNRLIEQALALKEPLGALRTAGMSDASRYGKSGTKTGNVGTPQDALPTHPNGLTNREVEVLRLLASGRLNREIAGDLALSLRTVEHHIAHIYSKIGARGRADATSYTIRHELL
jgi:ATP/maltotriose-dependent transcriptional regulator MalT